MGAQFFIGQPIHFIKNIYVYPALVKDVIGNPEYARYVNVLTQSQEDIWDLFVNAKNASEVTGARDENAPTPMEFLMANCHDSPVFMTVTKKALEFFTHSSVRIIPENKIILFTNDIENVKDVQELPLITEDNFFEFQNLIRIAANEDPIEKPKEKEHPKIARMKALSRYRDKIKKKNGTKDGISLDTMICALCCMGIGLNPLNVGEISYHSALRLFSMSRKKEKYETDVKIMTAGFGNSKIKPKDWMIEEK